MSSSSDINNQKILKLLDQLFQKELERPLSAVEIVVINGALVGKTYLEIAKQNSQYSHSYIAKDAGPIFFKTLSKILKLKVRKDNLKSILSQPNNPLYLVSSDKDNVLFEQAKVDYCEQLRNAFDDVKFGGIAVEGQEIDRAEKLADIFVMPDVLEVVPHPHNALHNQLEVHNSVDKEATHLGIHLNVTGEVSQHRRLLAEQQIDVNWKKSKEERGKIISAQKLLKRNKRMVLLGVPGSGKTTLINYWVVRTCTGDHNSIGVGLPNDCVPILIRIRDLARHPEMGILEFAQDFAQRELSTKTLPKGFFEYWLENSQALILLDGLDEVADKTQRRKNVEKINNFLRQYKENPAIITSRPSGYKRDFFRIDEYPHYELQPFDDSKIDKFLDHWYDSRFDLISERQRRKQSLRKALTGQRRIKRLARNPLLLTIIALIHRYQAQLPRERYKLYDKAVETLLTSWDANKELSNHETLEYLQLDDLRRLMERLAYWIHSQGGTGDEEGGTLIDREELIAQLGKYIKEMKGVERYQAKEEAKRFLELVVRDRAGLLAQQGQDRYAFVHKTFQEYLTAMEIRDRQEEGFEVVLKHVEEHLHDPHWEEVLLLLIAQQKRSNPSRLLEAILNRKTPYEQWLHRNLFFAGLCLSENITVTKSGLAQSIIQQLIEFEIGDNPRISKKFKQKIFQSITSLYETQFSAEAMHQLISCQQLGQWRLLEYQDKLYPEQAAVVLLDLLKDDDWKVQSRAAESLGKLGKASESVVDGLLALLQYDDSDVRFRAAESLGKLGNASEPVLNGLLSLLQGNDRDTHSRAAESLGKLGKASESVIEGLLGLLKDDNWNVRYCAAESLGKLGNASEPVLNGLLSLVQDNDSDVRSRAAESLGKLGNASESILDGLLALLKDDDSDVRSRAAESLGKLGNTSDSILDGLLDLLKDDNWNVRYCAAESLGKLGNASEPVLNGLLSLVQDNDSDVRSRAAESLGKLGNASELVLDGLLGLLKDEEWNVCARAASSLVKLGKASESVLNGLLTLLKNDEINVRSRAAESLVKLGHASESVVNELLALLKDDDMNMRSHAAKSLGELSNAPESVLNGLLALLQDDDMNVRYCAVESLIKLDNTSDAVLNGLLALLKDHSFTLQLMESVSDRAATSLIQLGQKSDKVLPALVQWIEQNENQPYVGKGIDILSELVP